MPDPNTSSQRPPSRRWIVPVIVLLVLVLGTASAWLLHRPPAGPSAPPEAAPGPTAAEFPPASAPPKNEDFQPPKILASRPVRYPEQALLNRVEGVVRVKFTVDETGHVTKAVVDKGSGSVLLDAMALDYDLRQWTFQPATLFGRPVPGTLDKEFVFRLDPVEQQALAQKRLATPVGVPDAPYPPEALPLKAQGACTIGVTWTAAGLVDTIYLAQSSGSNILDRAALRFAFEHWRIDPKDRSDKEFRKTMTFTMPPGPNDTPPPLAAPAQTPPPPATP